MTTSYSFFSFAVHRHPVRSVTTQSVTNYQSAHKPVMTLFFLNMLNTQLGAIGVLQPTHMCVIGPVSEET
jgi:hypothetical protein